MPTTAEPTFPYILTHQYQILEEIYDALNGSIWWNNTNWKTSEDPAEFNGVSLTEGIVTEISLYKNHLKGPIPSALGELSGMTTLRIGFNSLTGTIPPEIFGITDMKYLNLYRAHLTGTIPEEISSLQVVTYLNFALNSLTGTLPPTISACSMLQQLMVYKNIMADEQPELDIASLTHYAYEPQLKRKVRRSLRAQDEYEEESMTD
jgi:hypothetical protein